MRKLEKILPPIILIGIIILLVKAGLNVYHHNLVKGVTLGVFGIGLFGVMLIAGSVSASNAKHATKKLYSRKKFNTGQLLLRCANIQWEATRGNHAHSKQPGTLTIGSNGIMLSHDDNHNGYQWHDVLGYKIDNDNIIIETAFKSSCTFTIHGVSRMKCKAVDEQFAKQGVLRLQF